MRASDIFLMIRTSETIGEIAVFGLSRMPIVAAVLSGSQWQNDQKLLRRLHRQTIWSWPQTSPIDQESA
jgi:hypothetical protein